MPQILASGQGQGQGQSLTSLLGSAIIVKKELGGSDLKHEKFKMSAKVLTGEAN